jgi:hypothetical protein
MSNVTGYFKNGALVPVVSKEILAEHIEELVKAIPSIKPYLKKINLRYGAEPFKGAPPGIELSMGLRVVTTLGPNPEENELVLLKILEKAGEAAETDLYMPYRRVARDLNHYIKQKEREYKKALDMNMEEVDEGGRT